MPLLSVAVAKDLAKQVVNRYKLLHGLPTLAAGVVVAPTVKRVQNKIRQAEYRTTHQRFSEWLNNDNATILNHYQERLQALRVAKKAYMNALRLYNERVYADAHASLPQDTHSALGIIKDQKHDIFLAAQSLTYTGDGTTL